MAKDLEMDFATAKFEPEIRFGLIHLVGADLLPLSDGFATAGPGEITLRLSADLPAPWAGTSMVAIHMFQFPRGKAEFDRIVAWYGEGRVKRARLPEKVSFNPDMLAIQDPPQGWMHDGFARSGRDIVHIYQSPKRGILIRLMSSAGTMLDHPLLKSVHDGLRIAPAQWVADFPVQVPKPIAAADRIRTRKLTKAMVGEIAEASDRAISSLSIKKTIKPATVVAAIQARVDAMREPAEHESCDPDTMAIDLGLLWGQMLCEAKGWEWRTLTYPDGGKSLAVCSPDLSHQVNPINFIFARVVDPSKPNTCLLLFNMIVAGKAPMAAPGSLGLLN